MLTTTIHDALAVNIFLAIVSELPEFFGTLLIIHKDHPCLVQEQ